MGIQEFLLETLVKWTTGEEIQDFMFDLLIMYVNSKLLICSHIQILRICAQVNYESIFCFTDIVSNPFSFCSSHSFTEGCGRQEIRANDMSESVT